MSKNVYSTMETGILCPRNANWPRKTKSYVQERVLGQGKRNLMSKNVYSAKEIEILCPRNANWPRKTKSYVQERVLGHEN